MKNKTKRMGKTIIQYGQDFVAKYSWKCLTCSRVFKLRRQAENCIHETTYSRFGKTEIYIDKG